VCFRLRDRLAGLAGLTDHTVADIDLLIPFLTNLALTRNVRLQATGGRFSINHLSGLTLQRPDYIIGEMSISSITDHLYIGAMPRVKDARQLLNLNVRLILNMIFQVPEKVFSQPPFRLVTLRTFDAPFLPIPMRKLWNGVKEALPIIEKGEGVLVYCQKGRHRSVAMAACILIAGGKTADEAMHLITEKRPVADPYTWYIQRRIRKFEEQWNKSSSCHDPLSNTA
jgi:protein-tyrosine phosphatase